MQYTDVIFERMCTDVIHCEMSRRYINVTCNVYQRNVSVGLAKEASSSCKETDTVPVAPFTLAILVPKDTSSAKLQTVSAYLVLRFWCFYMTLCYHSQYMELFRVMWQGFLLSVMPFKLVQCQCLCFTFLHPCTRYKLTTLTFCESDVNKLAT